MRKHILALEDNQDPMSTEETLSTEVESSTEVDNEIADLAHLNIDELIDNETEATDLALKAEEEERQSALSGAVGELEQLKVASEAFYECMKGMGTDSQFKLATEAYKQSMGRLGFTDQHIRTVALEGFGTTDGKRIAFESIMSTIKAVFKKIIETLMKSIEWLKKVFNQYFSRFNILEAGVKKVEDAYLEHRKDYDKVIETVKAQLVNDKKGPLFTEAWLSLPLEHKKLLTSHHEAAPDANWGKNLHLEIKKVAELVGSLEVFKKQIDSRLVDQFTAIRQAVEDKQFEKVDKVRFFNPVTAFPPPAGSVEADMVDEKLKPDGCSMMASVYVGDRILCNTYAQTVSDVDLVNLSGWDIELKVLDAPIPNGSMGLPMTTAQLKLVSTAREALVKAVKNAQSIKETVEHTLTSLKSELAKLDVVLSHNYENAEANDRSVEALNDAMLFVVSAATAIDRSCVNALTQIPAFGFDVTRAWGNYVAEGLKAEKIKLREHGATL